MVTRQPASAHPVSGEALTIIGEGIQVHGRIEGEEDLRIEGRVEGSISLTETVHVAERGVAVATVEARDVIVSGVLIGNVRATNSVNLNPGAKLVGDIQAPRLIIADGAAFRGNVIMTEGSSSASSRAHSSSVSRPTASQRTRSSRGATTTRAQPAVARAPQSAAAPAKPRVAAVRSPNTAGTQDDEVTVIVRHSALTDEESGNATSTTKKKATKKSPPRGRVPKRGKRNVNRR